MILAALYLTLLMWPVLSIFTSVANLAGLIKLK